MAQYIDKDAVLAEIERRYKLVDKYETNEFCAVASRDELVHLKKFINSLKVKEVDIDKLCEFRENIGFAYPEGASEYQKQLACYRQGIKDVIKAQKGE